MDVFIGAVLEFVIDVLFQLIIQLALEFGFRSLSSAFGRDSKKNSFLAFSGYLVLGAITSRISLYFFPHHIIQHSEYRILNLVLTPFLLGWAMSLRGRNLIKNNQEPIQLDSFWFGFAFAATFTAIRFFYAH